MRKLFIVSYLTLMALSNTANAMADDQNDLVRKIIEISASFFDTQKNYAMKIEINELSVDISIEKHYYNAIELTNIYNALMAKFPSLKYHVVLSSSELDNTICFTSSPDFNWTHGKNCKCWCQEIDELHQNGGDISEEAARIIFNWYQPHLKAGNMPISVISFEFKDEEEIMPFLRKLYQALALSA